MLQTSKNKIIFLGDSITDAGRDYSRQEQSFGKGYAFYTYKFLKDKYSDYDLVCLNKGKGGDTTRDILLRLKEDVLDEKPNIVTLCIGVNDIWRRFDEPLSGKAVFKEEYEENLNKICKAILANGAKLVILSPYYVDVDSKNQFRNIMDEYVVVSEKIAKELSVPFVNLHKMFLSQLGVKWLSKYYAWDKIHPTKVGHKLIKKCLIEELNKIIDEKEN